MKIALVSQEYPPETARGGIGSQTYMKAKGLSSLGHQVYVISRSPTLRYEIMDGDICIIRIAGMEDDLHHMTEIVQWITHSACVAAELDALHKRVGLDIIDFPEWAAEGYVYLLNRTSWYGVPVVVQLHGPLVMFAHAMGWPDRDSELYRAGTQMEATCVRLADAVYSSSKCSSYWVRKHYNETRKLPTIHLGIDTELFKPQPVPKNKRPTIVFVGKLVRNKGVEELIEAASRLKKEFPDLQLCLVGRGQEKYIQHLVDKADGSDLLQFKGFVGKPALPQELSRAHIFAAPSYYEGGPGFVYLEAMACGLPVIGCSGSGAREIIKENENGLLVKPRDSHSLEQALRKLLSDENLSKDMGTRGRNYVVKLADTKGCLKKLEAFYHSVLHSKQMNRFTTITA